MVNLISKNYQTGVARFVCDTEAELEDLPKIGVAGKRNLCSVNSCNMGSTAIVTETSENFILSGNKNKWVKTYSPSSGDGGTELPEDWEEADKDDIDDLFKPDDGSTDTDSSVDDETLILPDSNGAVEDETWVIG